MIFLPSTQLVIKNVYWKMDALNNPYSPSHLTWMNKRPHHSKTTSSWSGSWMTSPMCTAHHSTTSYLLSTVTRTLHTLEFLFFMSYACWILVSLSSQSIENLSTNYHSFITINNFVYFLISLILKILNKRQG